MKYLTFIFFFFISNQILVSQDLVFSCESDGTINSMDRFCCKKKKCDLPVFRDIAFTPNAKLWGVSDKIYEINVTTCSIINSFEPLDDLGINRVGNGLVALDNETLISDYNDSLFKIDLNTQESHFIGVIGYYCSGDLELINGYIYMSTDLNQIIKIKLSASFDTIESIELIVDLGPGYSIYGLFSINSGEIPELGFSRGMELFSINLINNKIEQVCLLSGAEIFGTASIPLDNSFAIETINVLTPNNDGYNDYLFISDQSGIEHFEVLNRWGTQVFHSNEFPIYWNAKDNQGNEITEGVYFIITTYQGCNSKSIYHVNEISIFK